MTPVSPFQLLLVLSLAPQLVPASLKQYFLKYILEPPPCRSEPENCNTFCTQQEECPAKLQCCSAFCGIMKILFVNVSQDPNEVKTKDPQQKARVLSFLRKG